MFLRVEFRTVGRLRALLMRMGSGGLQALRGGEWPALQPSRTWRVGADVRQQP